MCRFVVAVGYGEELSGIYGSVISSLITAASNDPHGARLYGELQHPDGWGKVLVNIDNGLARVQHLRSTSPIFKDPDAATLSVPRVGMLVDMVHARAASSGTPINIYSTHPVRSVTQEGHELYMIHNGSFRKPELAALLGMGSHQMELYNDTYLANLALSTRIKGMLSRGDIEWLVGYVKTAANLGVVEVAPSHIRLIVGEYYRTMGDGKDDARSDYFKIYHCRVGRSSIYASSTLIDFYRPSGLTDCTALRNGEYHAYTIRPGDGGSLVVERETWLLTVR